MSDNQTNKNIEEEKALDIYEQNLQKQKIILQECQVKNSITSCLSCKDIIGCQLRKEYVVAVYESMNKGAGGGFEF